MKQKSTTSIILGKLIETFEWFIPPHKIPTRKKLYYEAQRIERALNKKEKKCNF